MNDTIRFTCPACNKSADERRQELLDNISIWVNSDALKTMVSAFGYEIPECALKEKIDWLNEFANEWDYRKKQSAGDERWSVTEDPTALANSNVILNCVRELGLVDIEYPLQTPDYILPLGGARMSNYARPAKAKDIIDKMNIRDRTIVALSGTRPINDVERPYIDEYAPAASTEFEAMSKGLEKVFSLREDFTEEYSRNSNINLEWALRSYHKLYSGNKVMSLAAPSSDPNRRANSRDTFEFFLEKFRVSEGMSLLLVTSCIYVPFQLLRFMDLAIDRGFYVDCVGMPNDDKKGTAFSQISNYCQETKATINAIKSLSDKWL